MTALSSLAKAFFQTLRPPPKFSLSEWADANAVLSAESSAEAGRWKTLPYQREMMDSITDPSVESVVVMKSARVGYTKMLNHAIAFHIDHDPCSIMLVQPTIEDAEGYSKEEIAPMLRDTPCLSGRVSEAKSKSGENTILQKLFPGGTLGLVGANSPRGFRRVSRRVILLDEVDGYPVGGAGTEGDQVKLAIRRSEYFWNRTIVMGSTPLVKDTSRIEREFLLGDQRRRFLPCPQCGHFDYLVFREAGLEGNKKGHWLKFDTDEPMKAHFVCRANGCVIEHKSLRWMDARGEWRPTAVAQDPKRRSYHIWAAYSYSPNATWGQLAFEWTEAVKDATTLQTFVNTVLGETWEEEYSAKVGADSLEARAEPYSEGDSPWKAVILCAGVDVQGDRLEIVKTAYAEGEESWIVEHEVIRGDPARDEVWKQLDESLFRRHPHARGGTIPVHVAAIDSGGHYTHEVYNYVRTRANRSRETYVIATKGASQRNKPALSKPTKVDVNFRGQSMKNGAEVYLMGSDTIKTTIYGRLKHNEPGPGFMHFGDFLSREFYEQLTAEKKVTRYVKGMPVSEWTKKPGQRNEVLDCVVMAYAALQFLFTKYDRKSVWSQFERKLAVIAVNKTEKEGDRQPEKNTARLGGKGRGGFVSRW